MGPDRTGPIATDQEATVSIAETNREFWGVPEVAAFFRISESAVWAALARGEFTRVRIGGSTRIHRSEIHAIIPGRPA
jgi:predicted DNA-binding transcriptional regulator AlpA